MTYIEPKLIAFDLDGTLAESKQRIAPEMAELLDKLTHRKMVAVISGASFKQFEDQFLPFLTETTNLSQMYLFPTSASVCYTYVGSVWTRYYDESLTADEKTKIFKALDEALEATGMKNPTEKIYGERIEDRGTQITFSALGQQAPVEEKKKWDPDKEKRRPLYEVLVKLIPEFNVAMNASTSIDITRKGIDKAYGVMRLCEIANIKPEEIVYVGDALDEGGNDSMVVATGVQTHAVFNPEETAKFIQTLL